MNKYQNYMDSAESSSEFQEKLKGLAAPKKTSAWRKYGAMAAALVLAIGLGAWGIGRLPKIDAGEVGGPVPEIGEVVAPVPEPYPMPDTQTQTMAGYEIVHGESVSYYMLPYIKYGQVTEEAKVDVALPVGVYRRDLTREELTALLDGESSLTQHLNWGGYELYAFAMLNRDGSLWQLHIEGRKGDSGYEHFELQIRSGELPAVCCVYPASQINEIWGVEVIADGHDGENASSRRLSFLHGDYGYRFEIVGVNTDEVEDIASRAARFFILGCCPYFAPQGSAEGATTMPYDPSVGNTAAEEPAATAAPTPPPTGEEGVRLSAENATPTGLTLVLERTAAGGQYMTGTPFHLERWEDGRWLKLDTVPYEGEGVLTWEEIGWLFPEEVGGRYEHSVSWTLLYGELTAGQYRMVKEVSVPGGKTLMSAEFEITD